MFGLFITTWKVYLVSKMCCESNSTEWVCISYRIYNSNRTHPFLPLKEETAMQPPATISDWLYNIISPEEFLYTVPAYKSHIHEEPLSNVIVEMTTGSKIIRNGSN